MKTRISEKAYGALQALCPHFEQKEPFAVLLVSADNKSVLSIRSISPSIRCVEHLDVDRLLLSSIDCCMEDGQSVVDTSEDETTLFQWLAAFEQGFSILHSPNILQDAINQYMEVRMA
ncbi:hypothetical protein LJC20_05070 [Eubacteriales bacterium OttesenSCG-928-M02]|nr:hypothetical protein [Eubacteriales bacterium OttesenSCG-928-M02]